MKVKEIENELYQLFTTKSENDEIEKIKKRGYVCAIPQKSDLLFIGINPSYTGDTNQQSFCYEISNAVNDLRHFKEFQTLISDTEYEKNWTFIDLFYFRETNQKLLDFIIRKDVIFIVEQLRLTNKIIKYINPKIIVVANSKASNFFGINKFKNKKGVYKNIWYGLDFYFNTESGLMKVKGINENSIIKQADFEFYKDKHFLFTSSLKYMNRFEKERIKWLIKRIK